MIRRPPRYTLFPYRRSSDLANQIHVTMKKLSFSKDPYKSPVKSDDTYDAPPSPVFPSQPMVKKDKRLINDCNENVEHTGELVPSKFAGFTTCRGERFEMSDSAIKKAKSIFNDCSDDANEKMTLPHLNLNENKASSSIAEITKINMPKSSDTTSSAFLGFSTAKGSKVAISSHALSRAQNIFAESINMAQTEPDHSHKN